MLTLGEFRNLTVKMDDDIPITYHSYDKGCCLSSYRLEDIWIHPKNNKDLSLIKAIVINPASDYDSRTSRFIKYFK